MSRCDRRHGRRSTLFGHAAAFGGVHGSTRLACALAAMGRRDEAQTRVRELLSSSPGRHLPAFGLAMAYAGFGDVEGAFGWLDRSYGGRDAFLHTIKATPGFESLHADPRWGALLRRIGLADD